MINEQENYNLYPLFSSPVLKVKEKFKMSIELKKYIENLPMLDNDYNLISENKNILTTDEKFIELRNYISKWLNYYVFDVLRIKNVTFYITQSWFNITRKLEKHHPHHHPNSIVSGVFHLDDDMSNISFFDKGKMFDLEFNYKDWNLYNGKSYSFPTESNTLILFPSNTHHRVDINENEKDRISLSFNTYVKGKVGDEKQSDLLYLG